MPTTMHNTASGDGGAGYIQYPHIPSVFTYTYINMHAHTLMVMRHRAVYAQINRKSLISVTGRALASEELANSCLTKRTFTINQERQKARERLSDI